MVRVLMGYLKRWVFRRRLKVSTVGESLTLRRSPLQTVGAKSLNDLLPNSVENCRTVVYLQTILIWLKKFSINQLTLTVNKMCKLYEIWLLLVCTNLLSSELSTVMMSDAVCCCNKLASLTSSVWRVELSRKLNWLIDSVCFYQHTHVILVLAYLGVPGTSTPTWSWYWLVQVILDYAGIRAIERVDCRRYELVYYN